MTAPTSSKISTRTDHAFVVTVSGCSSAEAEQVMAERIGYDEDYGFEYRISYADPVAPEA
jgi:hypothetical protein